MSVAEKPITETTTRAPSAVLALQSLLGGVLLLIGLWVILAGLPLLWSEVLAVPQFVNEFLSAALLLIATILAIGGLAYLGLQMERANYRKGLREGVIVGAFFLYIVFRISIGAGNMMERAELGAVGIFVTIALGLGLVFLLYKWFSLPGFAAWLGRMSDSGWFEANVYKGSQGVRIRRLTVIALLVLGFWGIITIVNQRLLGMDRENAPNNWLVSIPFTGGVGTEAIKAPAVEEATVEEVRFQKNAEVKVDDPVVILKTATREVPVYARRAGSVSEVKVKAGDTVSAGQELVELNVEREAYALPLMFRVHIVVPILLCGLLIWFAWRVVNLPTFSDFLIATEAEMNKVSWTSRKRLFQDTIVVLTTVILMTVFLFVVDILWIKILSSDWIYVLQVDTREARSKLEEKAQW